MFWQVRQPQFGVADVARLSASEVQQLRTGFFLVAISTKAPFARGTDAAGTRTHTGSLRTHFCENCVKLHRIALPQPHRLDPELLRLAFRPVTIHAAEIPSVVSP